MATFNYSSKSSIKDNLTEILVGAGLIIVPVVYPFGIKSVHFASSDRYQQPSSLPLSTVHAVQSLAEDT